MSQKWAIFAIPISFKTLHSIMLKPQNVNHQIIWLKMIGVVRTTFFWSKSVQSLFSWAKGTMFCEIVHTNREILSLRIKIKTNVRQLASNQDRIFPSTNIQKIVVSILLKKKKNWTATRIEVISIFKTKQTKKKLYNTPSIHCRHWVWSLCLAFVKHNLYNCEIKHDPAVTTWFACKCCVRTIYS